MTVEMLKDKIDDVKDKEFKLNASNYIIYNSREIDSAQKGYRYNDVGSIEEWETKFYIIGKETGTNDLLLVDHTDNDLPVYSMPFDYWALKYQASTSLEEFIKIMNNVLKLDFTNRENIIDYLKDLKDTLPEECHDFWEILLSTEFEIINKCELFDIDE